MTREVRVHLPVSECALVLVDVWDRHQVVSHQEQCDRVVQRIVAPLLAAARSAGLRVIHAPGSDAAAAYPGHHAVPGEGGWVGGSPDPTWPPPAFVARQEGAEWMHQAVEPEVARLREARRIHPACEPLANEPVVAGGVSLHAVLRERRIAHLFYAGFAANLCVLNRDYGMRAFHGRGYATILVRDATAAIETAETLPGGLLMEATRVEAEMNFGGSIDAAQLRVALTAR